MTKNPRKVRRILRKEVAFGCPMEGCGSPYLSYHHFDPPWAEKQHNNPEGMVALCAPHHKSADQGAYSKSQLHECKKNPYLKRTGQHPRGQVTWKREQIVFMLGNFATSRCAVLLKSEGKSLIWTTQDNEGNELLNLEVFGENGKTILLDPHPNGLRHHPSGP